MQKIILLFKSLLLALLCGMVWVAEAQQVKKVPVQGFLKDATGKAIADGPQSITFKLYTVLIGGTAEWTDTQTVNVFGGVYSTVLGSATNPVDVINWNANTFYLGVTIQDTELTPRTELTYAPSSLGVAIANEEICSGAVGDVKYSILEPAVFASVNGSCWVPMDGRALAPTDKLRQTTGLSSLPNGGGMFLRNQEFATSPVGNDPDRTATSLIATLQDQSFLSHSHTGTTSNDGGHSHNYTLGTVIEANGQYIQFDYPIIRPFGGDTTIDSWNRYRSSLDIHTHTLTLGNTGGAETRPKNLNFWVYIRIN
jgi:hypothetical protein